MKLAEIKSRLSQDKSPTIDTGEWRGKPNSFYHVQVKRDAIRKPEHVRAIFQGVRDLVKQGAQFRWDGDVLRVELGEFRGSFDTSTHGEWYAAELNVLAWPNIL